MKWNIICRVGEMDDYNVNYDETKKLFVPLLGNKRTYDSVQFNFYSLMKKKGLFPPPEAVDLINISLSVYTADKLIPRDEAYNGWERYFILHIPVLNTDLWNKAKDILENMLSFLSGDKWVINFRNREKTPDEEYGFCKYEGNIKKVSLFSGGMDSFIGAIDLLNSNNMAFVSLYGAGGDASTPQDRAMLALQREYNADSIMHCKFHVQPMKKGKQAKSEPSTRSRSFLFIAHGVAVASSLGSDMPLYISENGLISLNIPLTPARMGSLSTRTTHPFFLFQYMELLNMLGLKVKLINPYRFFTKGEMILQCKNQEILKNTINVTMSCSHPSAGRFDRNLHTHCGYCVPCIIRRAALYKAGIDNERYLRDVLTQPADPKKKSGQDLRAFLMAITRRHLSGSHDFFSILRSGPLPVSIEEKDAYAKVYKRGMDEVEAFLRSNNNAGT